MKIIDKIDKMKTYARIMKKGAKLTGLIPTMGFLHEGHLSLMKQARKQSDHVVASIFVNPMQFGPDEDFKKYPRDMKRDEELARGCGVDVLFYPKKEDMYPRDFATYVNVEKLTDRLCGKSRPGHFKGVTTVVLKLFEIIRPDIAYFGQKDCQQAFIIKKMIEDLNLDVTLKILPIVREDDGLAMSSRNTYLTPLERQDALYLHKSLELARELIDSGEKDTKIIIGEMKAILGQARALKIEYLSIVDTKTLKDLPRIRGEVIVALAAHSGKTRLIDNIIVEGRKVEGTNDNDKLLLGRREI